MGSTIKSLLMVGVVGFIALVLPTTAAAHVVVSPKEAFTGEFKTFTVSVPNEKDVPTVALKLEIPVGLTYVTPTVKQGWTIKSETTGPGEDAKVTSISWTGGTIPVGQRDDFTFSAKLPDDATELQWKAYQTYENGVTVSWDQSESGASHHEEDSNSGPFSKTKIKNDSSSQTTNFSDESVATDKANKAFVLASIALGLSVITFVLTVRKR